MIGGITFMGKSRIRSMGGLLWALLGLIVDCYKYSWLGWHVLGNCTYIRTHTWKRISSGKGCLKLIWLGKFK